MKSIHVLRKPCAEPTVAANVLQWGTGALNIDNTRIGNWQTRLDPACNKGATGRARFNTLGPVNTTGYTNSETKNGRWPANLVLQHLDGCVQDGANKIKAMGATGSRYAGTEGPANINTGDAPLARRAWVSDDGTETVAAWACVEGCPVFVLDNQTKHLQPTGNISPTKSSSNGVTGWNADKVPRMKESYGDSGGASRFFKQMQNGTAARATPTPDPPRLPGRARAEAQ